MRPLRYAVAALLEFLLAVFALIGVSALALLGCILREQRITWMLRKSQRRQWARQEHEG